MANTTERTTRTCRCGQPIPAGRKLHCSERCSVRSRKAALRGRRRQAAKPAPARRPRQPGERYDSGGRRYVHDPDHPIANSKGAVVEHRHDAYQARAGDPTCDQCGHDNSWPGTVVVAADTAHPVSAANYTILCRPCSHVRSLTLSLRSPSFGEHPAWGWVAEWLAGCLDWAAERSRVGGNGQAGASPLGRTPLTSEWGTPAGPDPDPTAETATSQETPR